MPDKPVETGKSGCLKALGIGCLGLLILVIVGGIVAYKSFGTFAAKLLTPYMSTHAVTIPTVEMSEAEVADVLQRFNSFTSNFENKQPVPALCLTAKEINILIQKQQICKGCSGKVYVTINDNKLVADFSFPLAALGDRFKERWCNGTASFQVGTTAGRIAGFIDNIKLDQPLPPEFVKALQNRNLFQDLYNKPEDAEKLARIDSISIQNGVLTIVPKTAP